jgi:ribonuclease BN (tRNA processing enzyme)
MSVIENQPANNTITFLGTGGARFMIISQLLASGGMWFNLGGTQFLVDPGPGCIIQTTSRKLNPKNLSAIIVSHRHLDHAADVNVMTEAMTDGGNHRHGRLFAPYDALETEPVILNHLRRRLDGVEILKAGGNYTIGNVSLSTPVRHFHGAVENYGLVYRTGKYTIAHITDTRYFEDLPKYYSNCDLLIMNIVFLEARPRSELTYESVPVEHLTAPDAERLVREIKPKIAIMTHFGTSMWRAKPALVAEQLTQKTGIRVMAATDGLIFALSELDTV